MFVLLLRKERSGDVPKVTQQVHGPLPENLSGAQEPGWGPCWTLETWWSPGLGSVPSPGRVDHPLERESGIINNNANKREKTKPAGPEHFLNKEISLISWLI